VRNALLIWQREMMSSLVSPVAYVAAAVYLLLAGWTFLGAVETNAGARESPERLLFAAILFWLPLFATAITMRLFAEEKRTGTLETLMTAPVSDVEAVAGKFGAALSLVLLAALPAVSALFVLAAFAGAPPLSDPGGFFGGCLILALLAGLCVAIGLFVSLLTRSQAVAAICCFAAICLPFLARITARLPLLSDAALEALDAETHILDFARGSLDTRPIVLYLSATWFVLFAAVKALEFRRWR